VSHFSVADKIYHDIFTKLLSEFSSEFKCSLYIFYTVSVDVEYWRVDTLSNVRGVNS